jgi:ATP-dependent RNA helicase DDX24/MAK5
LQIVKHLQAVAKHSPVRIVAVVGGMAEQKQARLLEKRPQVVVATPGRLWELISLGNVCFRSVYIEFS